MIKADGIEVFFEEGIRVLASEFFQNLFTSGKVGELDYLLQGVDTSISIVDNLKLLAIYIADEVHLTLKGMGPTKAPSFHGFSTLFF